jgi:hypothetical protein
MLDGLLILNRHHTSPCTPFKRGTNKGASLYTSPAFAQGYYTVNQRRTRKRDVLFKKKDGCIFHLSPAGGGRGWFVINNHLGGK